MEDEAVLEGEARGFTVGEVFIVLTVLCILSTIVVPRFSRASNQARLSEMLGDLQLTRSQIELYKIHHDGLFPGQNVAGGTVDPEQFVTDLTTVGQDGQGPYLESIPKNVYNGSDKITFVDQPGCQPAGTESTGWWFNTVSGEFRACDSVTNAKY